MASAHQSAASLQRVAVSMTSNTGWGLRCNSLQCGSRCCLASKRGVFWETFRTDAARQMVQLPQLTVLSYAKASFFLFYSFCQRGGKNSLKFSKTRVLSFFDNQVTHYKERRWKWLKKRVRERCVAGQNDNKGDWVSFMQYSVDS